MAFNRGRDLLTLRIKEVVAEIARGPVSAYHSMEGPEGTMEQAGNALSERHDTGSGRTADQS
jgi:hypothetical protein